MPQNPAAKLNQKLFDTDVEQKATRDGYGAGLVAAGDLDPNVVVLCADLTESTRSEAFSKKFPERFFEIGVAEQNLAAIAAGLGISGKIPFISSYATFSPGRNWEQIRTTISYNDSNVKIAGAHAGISVGPDGATHQAVEDIATMRVMANMKVFVPCDAIEARKATVAAAKIWGPIYLRFAREKSPVITTEETPYTPGKAEVFWDGKKPQAAIIATGPLVHKALLAARDLEKEGIETVVLDVHAVKPLDEAKVAEAAKRAGAVVTVEEHQVAGGLGGAIAEFLAKTEPVPMEFIGLQNVFGESGPPEELLEKYGMGAKDIMAAVKRVVKRK
ncbi:MAG: transketolase [Candidatus Liptonbacteria bacterium GWC1_60_9]|uniref:Transketolase n=3 Tax=Candidatus Liptoniibacteriota TaxID=1817909 RepID=A0A1G2CKL5_9BACT|nr:MAG: transketolase [Candidatus Liptonbacteria bacterium GWC1_60_9]OGY99356.1 MAG: transketolase [Candidatus Liptonbacteria bacterium RIFCSPHIGHO2_12_FULL_60_13]OGZ01797.1 MAG: transketolase [Candidatus Liptonbacteria bacterium RIFCSPLOWO2_12_FULL_60_15]